MIQLPKITRDPKLIELCRCRPICKHRRREWRGKIQPTSAELLLDRKRPHECVRRVPQKVYPNGLCPLMGRKKFLTVKLRDVFIEQPVVRICTAPVDNTVDTTYLQYAQLACQIGALDAVNTSCMFCRCGACCTCDAHEYTMRDAERIMRRRDDMHDFDARVRHDCKPMRIMYDKI